MLNSISSSNSDLTTDKESTTKYDKLEETVNALCTAVQAIEECNTNQSKCIVNNATDISNLKNCVACDSLTKNTIDVKDLTADNVNACTTTTNTLVAACVKTTNVKATNVETHNTNTCCLNATNVTSSSITADVVNSCQIITPVATIETATIETLSTNDFKPDSVTTTTLTTDSATIEAANLYTVNSNVSTVEKATVNDLTAEKADITDATIAEKEYNASTITLQKYLTVQSTTDLEIVSDSFTVIKNGKVFNVKNALGNVVAIYDDSDTLTIEFSKSGTGAKIRWAGNEPVSSEVYSSTGKNVFDLVAANSNDITVAADYSLLACINDKAKGNTWDSICVDTICSYRNDTICLQCPVEANCITLCDENNSTTITPEITTWNGESDCTCIRPGLVATKNNGYENCLESDHLCIKDTANNCYAHLSENGLCFNQNDVDSLKLVKEGKITGVTCLNVSDQVVIQPGNIVTCYNGKTSRLQADLLCINSGDGDTVYLSNDLGLSVSKCNDDYLSTAHYSNDSLCLYEMDRTTGDTNKVEIDVTCASLPATDVNGNLCVTGDIYQTGSSYTTHAEDLNVNCCLITTRANAAAAMASTEYSGLKVCMGLTTADDLYIAAKNDGQLYIGKSTSLQPLATRTNLTDGCFIKYDATNKTLVNADNPKPDYTSLTKGCLVCYDGSNLANAEVSTVDCVKCAGTLYSANHTWTADELYCWLNCGKCGCVLNAVYAKGTPYATTSMQADFACKATCATTATYACRDGDGCIISSCYVKCGCKVACADSATTATNANYATSAGSATTAANATYAADAGFATSAGSATTASKAEYSNCANRDASGNIISSYYAKKSSSCCSTATNLYGYITNNTLYLYNN